MRASAGAVVPVRFGETLGRIGVGRILAIAVVLVALIAVGVRAVGWTDDFQFRGDSINPSEGNTASGAVATTTASEATEPLVRGTTVVVHVAGAVLRPGVYELPGSSRMVDAVESAGGPSAGADTSAVNLAALLVDGAQVYLPSRAEVAKGWVPALGVMSGSTAPGSGASSTDLLTGSPAGGPVNINTAGVAELDTLPGIGQVTAGKIVADRAANGPFRSIDDLGRISGIGDAKIGALEGLAVAR